MKRNVMLRGTEALEVTTEDTILIVDENHLKEESEMSHGGGHQTGGIATTIEGTDKAHQTVNDTRILAM
jgi:hypothetical protein